MGQLAEHVYTDQTSIQHIKSLIRELPANGHVVLLMKDGSSCDGVVATRPNVQLFRDPDEREGINAEVKLERPDVPDWKQNVWLDEIIRVEHLDSIRGGEN
jgi:hypothetical protein